ncbi:MULTISPECIES: sigma-70 family RNA polymerase sigma factor [unclassified Afipia]|uniref:sigma-70 family RNA polymerase sigma factor n=1 Tax=unclassified Afipia TaxID=2642050 RepID=UPI000417DFE0|nr:MULTISPECIES: sigma-70 family RNA polymerase sigma factor [unclassified Afipia]
MTSPAEDDPLAELMRAAQAGNSKAYALLLGEITPRLRRMVRGQRRFLNAEDVEDIVQEILISLHAVLATYDPGRPFMPWLMTIARNRLADAARRYSRHEAHEVHVEEFPVTFSEGGANIESEEYRDPEVLKHAIRSLPPGQREAIEMLKLREMSLKEASVASGMTVGALKVSVHRAVATLRRALKKE